MTATTDPELDERRADGRGADERTADERTADEQMATAAQASPATGTAAAPVLDLVVPVYNEVRVLESSIRALRAFLDASFPVSARITIVDNASTDGTFLVAQRLAHDVKGIAAIHLDEKGRGRALRAGWSASDAQIVAYTDVDLSTDLAALAPMVTAIMSGHSDVAIGSRLHSGARVTRGPKREFISRSYNLILRTTLATRFSDAQCGFKAVRADVARALLPLIEDDGWFFDTELLVLAQRSGLRILEVPVDWIDDPDSRVDVVSTAVADLKGVARLVRGLLSGSLRDRLADQSRLADETSGRERGFGNQLTRFALIGLMSTVAYIALFAVLRDGMSAVWANFAALLVTAVANTAANRRMTFDVKGRGRPGRDHAVGLAAFGVGLALTTGSLWLLSALDRHPGRLIEIAVLLAASALGTLFRFVALRAVLVHSERRTLNGAL